MPVRRRALTPPQLLILSFARPRGRRARCCCRCRGPRRAGTRLAWYDALFTATSAVCVTGLIVVDTPLDLSLFGQVVVLLLIQAGGLGYMTFSTLVGVALGRRITLQERQTLVEGLNAFSPDEVVRFALSVFRVTVVFEAVGAHRAGRLVGGHARAGARRLARRLPCRVGVQQRRVLALLGQPGRRHRPAAGPAHGVAARDPRRPRLLHHPRGGVDCGDARCGCRCTRNWSSSRRPILLVGGHRRDLPARARQPGDARRTADRDRRGWRRGSSRSSRARPASTRSPSAPAARARCS